MQLKKKCKETHLSISPLFDAYCNSMPSLKQFLLLDLKMSLVKVHDKFVPPVSKDLQIMGITETHAKEESNTKRMIK